MNSTFNKIASIATVATLLALTTNAASQSIAETRDIYKEYISVRKLIGEEKNTWTEQKVALEDMIAVVSNEIEENTKAIETMEDSAGSADKKRAELQEKLELARRASSEFNAEIATFETRLKNAVVQLPDVLKKEIAPLVVRIPEDPENTRLSYSQRLQTVIGILAQIDKFNSDLRFVTEVKNLEDGSHEVSTLYFGLATAIFSNGSGTYAGHGKPSSDGWSWVTVSGSEAESVTAAIEIYGAKRPPEFVSVPMNID